LGELVDPAAVVVWDVGGAGQHFWKWLRHAEPRNRRIARSQTRACSGTHRISSQSRSGRMTSDRRAPQDLKWPREIRGPVRMIPTLQFIVLAILRAAIIFRVARICERPQW
jgi:hypothetical protein